MARLTWLGEDRLHAPDAGPSFTIWAGIQFPKGEAVEVTDKGLIGKARNNQFFEVTGVPGRPPKVKSDEQDEG